LNSANTIVNEFPIMKIQAMNQYTIMREASEHVNSPRQTNGRPSFESSGHIDFFGCRKSFARITEGIIGYEYHFLIPRASLRPLNGRITYHPERLSCSRLVHPLRPARPTSHFGTSHRDRLFVTENFR
jgi:hypothetical protein